MLYSARASSGKPSENSIPTPGEDFLTRLGGLQDARSRCATRSANRVRRRFLGSTGFVYHLAGIGCACNLGQSDGGHLDRRDRWVLHLPADATDAALKRRTRFALARQPSW